METSSGAEAAVKIVPSHTIAGIVLMVLFLYFFFRHFMLVLMIMDLVIGWLRQFRWFPKEGKRLRTLVHWLIAFGLIGVYLAVAGSLGWLNFVPK
ncbi:MAG: hypothetical protein AAGJ28_22300 [Pseudomonadota bacterium]